MVQLPITIKIATSGLRQRHEKQQRRKVYQEERGGGGWGTRRRHPRRRGTPTIARQQIRSATDRCLDRSYNFHVESYVIPSSVRTNKCKQRYGIANEAVAAVRYEEVLKAMGHNVTVSTCGLLLNPAFPWLGASPDRIVYDPLELSYGVVEIKCPYSLRDTKGDDLVGLSFCSELTDTGPKLSREHHYYSQLIGQMGVSELSWGDFVIFSKNFILIERVRLNKNEWEVMKGKLQNFYFSTLLPFLETTARPCL
ncbi:hypothetical protein MTO96_051521 [Rhipicephalus appendiculatus]